MARRGLLPTPTVKGNHAKAHLSAKAGDGLATAIGGRLNPRFVEWMMGFPVGWTEIGDYGPSGMLSFHSAPKSSDE
jgi:hypothetical protein